MQHVTSNNVASVCMWLKRNHKPFTKMTFCWNFSRCSEGWAHALPPRGEWHRVNKVGCGQFWKWWILSHVLLSGSLAFLSIKLLIAIGEKNNDNNWIVFFCFSVEVCMSYACTSWCWVKRRSGSKKLLKDFLTAASSVNLLECGTQNLVLKTQVKLLKLI